MWMDQPDDDEFVYRRRTIPPIPGTINALRAFLVCTGPSCTVLLQFHKQKSKLIKYVSYRIAGNFRGGKILWLQYALLLHK